MLRGVERGAAIQEGTARRSRSCSLCAVSRARGGAVGGAEIWPEPWTGRLPISIWRILVGWRRRWLRRRTYGVGFATTWCQQHGIGVGCPCMVDCRPQERSQRFDSATARALE